MDFNFHGNSRIEQTFIEINSYHQQWLAAIVAQAKTRTKTTAASLAVGCNKAQRRNKNDLVNTSTE
jgi:hypothetical protein